MAMDDERSGEAFKARLETSVIPEWHTDGILPTRQRAAFGQGLAVDMGNEERVHVDMVDMQYLSVVPNRPILGGSEGHRLFEFAIKAFAIDGYDFG